MATPMNQMNTANMAPSHYTPVDALNRHEYGVQKNRKQASTGGGRAWSEDEEVYLLQTRLQKMPYKHIAAHLKKTELACRLHYHQLSHGSNRRKRTNSFASSSTGSATHSPIMTTTMPSPIHESEIRSVSPPNYTHSPSAPFHVQLPAASTLLPRSATNSPPRTLGQPIAILPKPLLRRPLSDPISNQPLRLDCDVSSSQMEVSNVDKDRLRQAYEVHRTSFWNVIASEYGAGVSPFLLEETWKQGIASRSPPTPCISPESRTMGPVNYSNYQPKPIQQLPTPVQETKSSATSISSLLGIDASPRSPSERELIKRMEEQQQSREPVMT